MIDINSEQFEQLLPFVGAATEDVFEKMQPSFVEVYDDLMDTVVGSDFEADVEMEGSPLQGYVRNYVILATFLLRLRSNDLIMTDTGFGVVSNENIAPASQARVDALERELSHKRDVNLYTLINQLRHTDGWADTPQAEICISSFIWCPWLLKKWCGATGNVTFDDVAKHRQEIDAAENVLRRELSDDLMEQLLSEERNSSYAPSHRAAIFKICGFIGSNVSMRDGATPSPRHGEEAFTRLLSFIEDHIDDFPKYKNSSAYKANHMQAYENKTDDPTFFFVC